MDYYTNKNNERIGIIKTNHQGLQMEVVEYLNNRNMMVKFNDGTIVKTDWKSFSHNATTHPQYKTYRCSLKKTERIGEKKLNHQNCLMEIVQYNHANDIIVQFDNNPTNLVHCEYQRFKKGNIDNPLFPSIYGVGITGIEVPCMNGKEKLKEYRAWVRIIERCYSSNASSKNITYQNCTVSDEFKYYPNFYYWIQNEENYVVWKNTRNFAIDKDIIQKGNKVYSPEKCCLVPDSINNLIQNDAKRRGKYAIGVTESPHHSNLLIAQCWNGLLQKNIHLGIFSNELDAFMAYKEYKEKLIKQTADEAYSKKLISKKCWEALYNYTIDITD